jgi:hypothetical protein
MLIDRISDLPGRLARGLLPLAVLLALASGTACSQEAGAPGGTDPAAPAEDGAAGQEPVGLFLTWRRDPSTTMVIDWHTVGESGAAVLQYRRAGAGQPWSSTPARSFPFPYSERSIHRVELSGLEPDATYEFRPGEGARSYLFRTMPREASRPIRFVAAGDTRHEGAWMAQTARQVTAYDPDFVLLGGDLAYADGRPERVGRWHDWFDQVKTTLITPSGRVIPILPTIGNHEVAGGYHSGTQGYRQDDEGRARIAPFFYTLFATPGQPGYGVIDFGNYMSIILLDTDHSNPIAGAQTTWLEQVLAARRGVPHLFPLYHVPAYPSVRDFENPPSQRVREHWVPLFERYGVRVAFENHDHAYKRTFPLRAGQRSPEGIVYLGDGAWGTTVRPVARDPQGQPERWYLERSESVRHFILGEIRGAERRFIMIDADGNVFDEFPAGSRRVIGGPRFALPAGP